MLVHRKIFFIVVGFLFFSHVAQAQSPKSVLQVLSSYEQGPSFNPELDRANPMLFLSWKPYLGESSKLIDALGGPLMLSSLSSSPRAMYPHLYLHDELKRLLSQLPSQTGITTEEVKQIGEIFWKKHKQFLTQSLKGSEVLHRFKSCGFKPVNIQAIGIPAELRAKPEVQKVLARLAQVFVFQDVESHGVGIVNIRGDEVEWKVLSPLSQEDRKDGKLVYQSPQPRFDLAYFIENVTKDKLNLKTPKVPKTPTPPSAPTTTKPTVKSKVGAP